MEDAGSSKTAGDKPSRRDTRLIAAPCDYILGPVYAATRQIDPREIIVGQRRYKIGGFHPLDESIHPPALDVRHARAIFTLLSFRKNGENTQLIRLSFNEFCRRYANSNGGRYARAIKKVLRDRTDSFIRVTDARTGIGHQYRLIERIDIETHPPRRREWFPTNLFPIGNAMKSSGSIPPNLGLHILKAN